jgi:phospholipase C
MYKPVPIASTKQHRRRRARVPLVGGLLAGAAAMAVASAHPTASPDEDGRTDKLSAMAHIVVIYEENHSFDNLYGGWEGVNGRANADAFHTVQLGQTGTAYSCLKQVDVNLTSPPLAGDCADSTTSSPFASHFPNAPFAIEPFIPPSARTCPQPGVFAANGLLPNPANLPGGCTRDLVHRFYQEQYQINGGQQNRYTTGSDAAGLTQFFYDTQSLPIYQYLHAQPHPHYAIADNFFQAAFGGSFLNHQYLIAAVAPTWPGAPDAQHSIVDANGFPNSSYPLYHPATAVSDQRLTTKCSSPHPAGLACGDYAVNTIQPAYQPFSGSPQLPAQSGLTIGDTLSAAGVTWAWYSGGWSNANGDVNAPGWTNGNGPGPACSDPNSTANPAWPHCPNSVFQYHHQAFNYYSNYAPGTAARQAHLRDEQEFIQLVGSSSKACALKSVSFIKPIGLENEHPGYTSEPRGSDHLVDLLSAIDKSACAKDTIVIVTYDEFGGQWDHVPPPGQGVPGVADAFGPGTRIPALIIAPRLKGEFVVDSTQYDTTSILATIERRYGLAPLGTRDAAVNDLSHVFDAKEFHASK